MKRIIAVIMILILAAAFTACGSKEEAADLPEASTLVIEQTTPTPEVDDVEVKIKIGFSLAGEDAFYQQLVSDIEVQCSERGYEPVIKTALTVEDQNSQMHDMITAGVSVIVLDPVDVDELETVLNECETHDIPVVNVIEMANGIVSTFITPDYMAIGMSAGRDAVELYGKSEAQCLMIKSDYDSFPMQLMTDGFLEEIGKDKDVTLYDEEYCGDDEEKAYEAAKAAIKGGVVDFIFAQSDTLAKGALRAIKEYSSEITVVAFGGDMELINAATKGTIYSCIFFGPRSLSEASIDIVDRFVRNPAYMPDQYIELRIEAAQGDDAPKYYSEGGLYAQIIGG